MIFQNESPIFEALTNKRLNYGEIHGTTRGFEGFERDERVKKEAMAKYFYDLSKLAFAAMVLGGMVSFFQDADLKWGIVIVLGMLMAISFCITGNNLLK